MKSSVKGTSTTYYHYDINGQRVRKVTEKTGSIKEERIYLGGYELFKEYIRHTGF